MATESTRQKTKICALNLDDELINYLSDRFDVYKGSVGHKVDVARINSKGLRLLPTLDVPNNLHEYEVVIEDMLLSSTTPYVEEDHRRTYNTGTSEYYIISYPPQTVANLYPIGSSILNSKLANNRNRSAIKIAFQAEYEEIEYHTKDIYDHYSGEKKTHHNYEHLALFLGKSIEGNSVKLVDNRISKVLFESLLDDITYHQTFDPPTKWKDEERVTDERFIPLLENKQGACISYIWLGKNNLTIILPQTPKKKELLENLFNNVLFKHFSDYFPEVEESVWIKNSTYYLPGHEELLQEKEAIVAKYESELSVIEKKIEDNLEHFSFLHDLLTSTGDDLVQAMIKYLQWMGFDSVIDKDTTQEEGAPLEEDIQVDLGDKGLLVIEVKGIGGTSTDAQCSQIHKIVFRRAKERGKFDVHGLYIANNELHKEPQKRTIPPFNKEQIDDAINDSRGIAYTWQFFNLFFAIEEGIISKAEARTKLLSVGLIDFTPSVKEVGIPYNYFKQHTVACVEIEDTAISVGDYFYYQDNERWHKVKVLSIQSEGIEVNEAKNGKFGFGLETRVPNNATLYIK